MYVCMYACMHVRMYAYMPRPSGCPPLGSGVVRGGLIRLAPRPLARELSVVAWRLAYITTSQHSDVRSCRMRRNHYTYMRRIVCIHLSLSLHTFMLSFLSISLSGLCDVLRQMPLAVVCSCTTTDAPVYAGLPRGAFALRFLFFFLIPALPREAKDVAPHPSLSLSRSVSLSLSDMHIRIHGIKSDQWTRDTSWYDMMY